MGIAESNNRMRHKRTAELALLGHLELAATFNPTKIGNASINESNYDLTR